MAERLKLSVPSATYRLDTELEKYHEPSKQALEIFTDRIKLLLAAEKKKQKECRERKRNSQRLAKQQSWNQSLQRVRRYLGIQEGNQDDHASTGNHLQQQKGQLTGNEVLVEAVTEKPASEQFDPFQPALYTQEDSVIFICVDIEAYERNHSLVTEIGIATLDTADITLTAPGRDGQNWKQAINARHFRIKEYGHLRNKDFVQGCAEHFQFGSSEWVSIGDTPHTMAECFKNPHLEAIRGPMPEVAIEDDVTLELRNQPKRSTAKRNIVLVGHDLGNDIDYLKGLGFDIHNLSNIHGLLDTATMYRALRKESQSRNLASILADLNIPGWYLHNAGNDAVYTLQAMLGIALKDLEGRWDGIESGVAGENGAWYSSQ
ncbi:MAG: hypothetical protein M1818_004719 [Claussenomyces sp. TS43310]|nr:MAG: hypothetical protein M1818_004719 [Claussenomyces sp. TS43310]